MEDLSLASKSQKLLWVVWLSLVLFSQAYLDKQRLQSEVHVLQQDLKLAGRDLSCSVSPSHITARKVSQVSDNLKARNRFWTLIFDQQQILNTSILGFCLLLR